MVPVWLVGVALLGAGLLQPAPLAETSPGLVSGDLEFAEGEARGVVDIVGHSGALFALGAHRTQLSGEGIDLIIVEHRYTKEYAATTMENPLLTELSRFHTLSYDVQRHRLTNAELSVEGARDGVLFAYDDDGDATFRTQVNGSSLAIEAVTRPLVLNEEGVEPSEETDGVYTLDAPILGLKNFDPDDADAPSSGGSAEEETPTKSYKFLETGPLPPLPRADLRTIEARGNLDVEVHRALVQVTSDQGDFSVRAERTESEHWDHAALGVGAGTIERVDRYVLVSGPLEVVADLADAKGGLAAHKMDYAVEGSLDLTEVDGQLADRAVSKASVGGEGRFLLSAEARKPEAWIPEAILGTGVFDAEAYGWTPERPPVRTAAKFEGDADELTVNGRPMFQAPSRDIVGPEVPETAGALLLALFALKKLALLLSPLYISNPLDKPSRRAIYDAIGRGGMVHLRELRRLTGVPLGTLGYHVEVLQRFGLVATVRLPGQLIIYQPNPGIPLSRMRDIAMLADPTRGRIGQVLAGGGALSQREVSRLTAVSVPSASRALARLAHAGLVERSALRNGRYTATPLLRQWYAGRRLEPAPRPQAAPALYPEPTPSRV